MPLYTVLHSLPNVLVQIANKMGLQKKIDLYAAYGLIETGLFDVILCRFIARTYFMYIESYFLCNRFIVRGLSPRANYTDQATAACRRS
jgi:hypothetical protein